MAYRVKFGYKSGYKREAFGQLEHEQEPLFKKIKLLAFFNPPNIEEGKDEGTPASHSKIKSFIDFYKINMNDFEPSDPKKYGTFEDFFIGITTYSRKKDAKKAVAVADSCVVTYATVPLAKKLWIKGSEFSITNLVMDVDLGAKFEDGSVASFRLSPQDYHRYHSPVSGTIKEYRCLPGSYYQVDPVALRSRVNILTSNARDYVVVDSPEFGEVLFVAIGATNVGTVEIHEKYRTPGNKIQKGDELGFFQFGGSSIIVAFQKDRVKFDKDLLDCSNACIQVSVEVGMSLGEATRPATQTNQTNNAQTSGQEHLLGTSNDEKSFAQAVKQDQ
ncbi:hypothetical protein N0V83_001890 [Neocucurbitaria cava]|uniref:Phosphatidylserine decarboxylase n=1 Tax=Neocucurbitaria cava TaxID=798079 RepID=A0A9W9CQA3_9PLEO|nr:hypothetical protein N0V83_001890 [Neocucurbitaria cava]